MHLTQVVDHRRQAKLELAGRALHEGEICNIRQAEAEYRAHWYNWTHDRSELRKAMLDEANIKKRRLDREKRSIERSRDGWLLGSVCVEWLRERLKYSF